MSKSSEPDLEEVDIEENLKKQEESGEDTGNIVLSEASDVDDDDQTGPTFVDSDDDANEGEKDEIVEDEKKEEQDLGEEPDETSISNSEKEVEKQNLDEESTDEDTDEEDNENMRKLEQDINKDLLFTYHPETKQINYKELLTLSKITKNKRGEIIDPLHTTIPFLTRYEKAKILGLRAKQINHGSSIFVDVPREVINGHIIASMELKEQKIPYIIRRPMPNGGSEYWKVSDLKIID